MKTARATRGVLVPVASPWRRVTEPFRGLVHLSRPPETVLKESDCAVRDDAPEPAPPPFFARMMRRITTTVIGKEVI